ncbi:MAG: glycosyltransferase family 4 protein [Synechococcales cyanobacterium M58_A2018_015]|nr:glycosyltransferase family 4 protein [Synechococcales cyanobacterium M58_A2018_015]
MTPAPGPRKISLLVWNLSTNDGAIRASLLGEALKRLGYDVEILGFLFGDSVYAAMPRHFPIVTVAGGQYPQFFRSIWQGLNQISGDVIYAIKPQPGSFGVALLKKLQTRRPVILDIDDWELSWHGGDSFAYPWRPKQLFRDLCKPNGALRRPDHPLYLQWMEKLIPYADAITVHTSFLQKRFGGTFVPNGKDTTVFDPQKYDGAALKARYGLENYRTLMFPGAPRPYKGLEDVLAALELLDQPDLKLVIVGGNPYDNYDETLRQQWGHRLIQLPRQPADAMPELVAAADVVVVPQRDTDATRAQFPLKLTDGMAMAKPVLATRVGDIPAILGEAGYLVDPSSPDQLAAQIQWIFEHPEEAAAKGQQARIRCVEQCSIDTMASQLSQVFSEVVPCRES